MYMTKKQTLINDYRKERRRINQQIRRMRNRGYIVPSTILPAKPKKITEASIRRLQKIKPETIYSKSSAISKTGQVVTGKEKRKEERKERAQKAAETRKRKSAEQADIGIDYIPTEGELVYNKMLEIINGVGANHPRSCEHLMTVFESEVEQYGFDKVMESIANVSEEFLSECETAVQYEPESRQHKAAITRILSLIRGDIPPAEELLKLERKLEEDDYMTAADGGYFEFLFKE